MLGWTVGAENEEERKEQLGFSTPISSTLSLPLLSQAPCLAFPGPKSSPAAFTLPFSSEAHQLSSSASAAP